LDRADLPYCVAVTPERLLGATCTFIPVVAATTGIFTTD